MLFSIVCIVLLFHIFIYQQQYADATAVKSLAEFDFSGYSFGIVAVAVSFGGVYISIVPERCSEQLMKLVAQHFIPRLFGDTESLEKVCHPKEGHDTIKRTAGIKCIHAVSELQRWGSLEDAERNRLLGPDGLGSNRSRLGTWFSFLQHQTDRLLISVVGIVISVLYVAAPFAYWFNSERAAAAVFFSVYILSVCEMILCASMYTLRYLFFTNFEGKMSSWSDDVTNFIAMKAQIKVQGLGPL